MCGIAGIFRWGQHPNPLAVEDVRRVQAMVDALRHRGPDDQDVIDVGGGAILGHTRLSILDLSDAAHQPMVTNDLALAYNGEIYGYRDLRRSLQDGRPFASSGDTEVLHRALEQRREGALEAIDGMFAFAAFDRRARRMILARDHLGKKPIFFSVDDGAIVFASELAALRAGGIRLEIDDGRIPEFLVRGYVQPPNTLCKRVEQICAGETLSVDASGAVERHRYWVHPWLRGEIELEHDVDRAARRLRDLFDQAVERRLAADVPLGAFLSGGFDSAAVVAVARRKVDALRTFTIGFEQAPGWDESAEAAETARLLGTIHTQRSTNLETFELLPELIARTGEPQGDSSFLPTHLVSALAREQVTVALTGDGGDELFGGYDRFLLAWAAARAPQAAGRIASSVLAGVREGPRSPRSIRRLKRLSRAIAMGPAATLLEWAGGATFEQTEAVLGQPIDREQLTAPEQDTIRQAASNGAPILSRLLAANLATYLPGNILIKLDRASMATSLETRSPLLDVRLLEFAVTLAPTLLARGLSLKWIAKRALAELVPEVVRRRPKRGFGAPVGSWFRARGAGALVPLMTPSTPLAGHVDADRVRRLIAEHMQGKEDAGVLLFRLWTLHEWLRWANQPRAALPTRAEGSDRSWP